jgi:hypothetical protein
MRIGRYWDGHGGIYAGIARGTDYDYHLILAENDMRRDMPYKAAVDWCRYVSADGFRDFRLPNRAEGALLYANLKDKFSDFWHWTSEDYPPDAECKWAIAFAYGRNADARMSDACRARAVRIEPCA